MTDTPTPPTFERRGAKPKRGGPTPSRKGKTGEPPTRTATKLSIDKYNEGYAAYLEKPTADHVAAQCGISWHTANKYCEKGDPARGLLPYKARAARAKAAADERADYDLAKARAEFQKAARAAFLKGAQRIQSFDPSELDPNRIPDFLAKLEALIERTMGEADNRVEVRGGRFAGWGIDELEAYLSTGATPANRR